MLLPNFLQRGRNCSHRFLIQVLFLLIHKHNNHWGRSWKPCVLDLVLGLVHFVFPGKFILNSNRFVTNFVTAFVLVSGSILNLYISSFCSMNKTEACFDHLAQFLCFLVHKLFLLSSRAIASIFLYLDSYCT